jgi:tryptophan 7-halogenase
VERIRDFLILHYHANARKGLPLWDQCRTMSIPDTLAAKIELFRSSGYIFREHEELFTEVGWLQVLIGQGVIPADYNRIADTITEATLREMLEGFEIANVTAVRKMPRHVDFIAQHCSAQKEAA